MKRRIFNHFLLLPSLLVTSQVFAQSAGLGSPIKSLVFLEATEPRKFIFKSSWFAPSDSSTTQQIDKEEVARERLKQEDAFEDALLARRLSLATHLNTAILLELSQVGYTISPIEKVQRRIRFPDWVDYKKLHYDADALLQIAVLEIGVFRPRDGSAFYPKLGVSGVVFVKGQRNYVFDDHAYFGPDTDEKKSALFIGKNPKNGFSSFEEVMNNLDAIQASYERAIPLLAKELVFMIDRAIKKSK